MLLLLDADGLIKLNRAGVLRQVVEAHSCVVPHAVYREVVTEGKARRYADADAIEEALRGHARIETVETPMEEPGLGAGEREVLGLSAQVSGAIVVSDDRRFLAVLSRRGSPYLTPADVLVLLRRGRLLTSKEAEQALERLRPAIRAAAYWEARQDLQSEGGGTHGQN